MAVYNHDGTNGSDSLIDYNHSSLAQFPYVEFNTVTINGFGGDDILAGFDLFSSYFIYGGAGNDFLSGGFDDDILVGDDLLDGVAGNDTLIGGEGNDALFGIGGNDLLDGGSGTDKLIGGDGNDVFQFDSVSDSQPGLSRDIIKDFVGNGIFAGDRIDLSRIDANTTIKGDQAFTYIGTRAFTAAGQIRYSGGILQGNTDSNLAANFEIQLEGSPLLVASDIIV
ncbi:M10 family metallopeptidase C-terminal domain-containing protein [Nostoc sp. ChiQUE01b]|uniref:calcium-binding protein n=1 Tax=Nostoc sp. ChiQUE01b TaxID=3075376 RepID=UPI002AD1FA6D|nr:M10 family metallopeptidase C-terminal domain-containing protein [Nostoc sp. ChiQUE01b]MDZ8261909.1 M10 family metallopeptidase C-terminal domain-containing protein [Nostoc sp. ChiQUE01b]